MDRSKEVLRVENLGVSFGTVQALTEVSFAFAGPGVMGVLGPNGAGKTTLIETLEGLRTPTSGRVLLFGENTAKHYPRKRVGAVLQKEAVFDRVTVHEYVDLLCELQGAKHGVDRVLKEARLEHRAHTPVERLSGGEAQRLYLSVAVAHDPELLFLDEPTAHLDPVSREAIGALIQQHGEKRAVVLCTHDLREADSLCHQVLFLVGGTVRKFGTREELLAAVPPDAQKEGTLADAFFHFCGVKLDERGDVQ